MGGPGASLDPWRSRAVGEDRHGVGRRRQGVRTPVTHVGRDDELVVDDATRTHVERWRRTEASLATRDRERALLGEEVSRAGLTAQPLGIPTVLDRHLDSTHVEVDGLPAPVVEIDPVSNRNATGATNAFIRVTAPESDHHESTGTIRAPGRRLKVRGLRQTAPLLRSERPCSDIAPDARRLVPVHHHVVRVADAELRRVLVECYRWRRDR
jgi:hypothetical protein